jgi:Protein of unknown function (DUF2442)
VFEVKQTNLIVSLKKYMLLCLEMQFIAPHQFRVRFSDALEGQFNALELTSNQNHSVFAPLKSADFASQAKLDHGTLCWPGEIDVAPEYIYFLTFRNKPELQNTFKQWGYIE